MPSPPKPNKIHKNLTEVIKRLHGALLQTQQEPWSQSARNDLNVTMAVQQELTAGAEMPSSGVF